LRYNNCISQRGAKKDLDNTEIIILQVRIQMVNFQCTSGIFLHFDGLNDESFGGSKTPSMGNQLIMRNMRHVAEGKEE